MANRLLLRASLLFIIACASSAQIHLPGAGGGASSPKPRSTATPSQPARVPVAYYVLALSWAPNFCADSVNAAANPRECATGRHIGFVVHGLWPEVNEGTSPESCENAKPVSNGIVKTMLPYMFSSAAVQREWAAHGTCSGLTTSNYFTRVIEARVAVQLPVQLTGLDEPVSENPEQIEDQFAGANPSFPAKSFRAVCSGGEFSGIQVCFDLDLKGRACPRSVVECSKSERVLPPR